MTADIATSLKDWSATAASNQPDNSDPIGPNILAENQRTIQAVVRAALAGGDTIASDTTTDIGSKDAGYLAVSGNTTITGLGTVSSGIVKILKFDGALTFTHHATSLILPTGANITTAAGDIAVMRSEGSGNWRCLIYARASGAPLVTAGLAASGSNTDITSLSGAVINAKRATVASHATTADIWGAAGNEIDWTGTATTTAFPNATQAGVSRILHCAAACSFTAGANMLIDGTASGDTFTCAANDIVTVHAISTTQFRLEIKKYDGTAVVSTTSTAVPVRQTVLSGPVDSSGLPNFGGSTGSTTVTASGTLKATAAAGGDANYTGSITNPSWTGLSTDGTMYLYLDITSGGVVTTGSTTLAPTYQWGGTYSTTSGQNTFNIQEMTMKAGDGAAAAQVYRVFVGEVTVASNVTTAIVWYALMGRYDSGYTNTIPAAGTLTTKNHNIGIVPTDVELLWQCLSADLNYAVGDVVRMTTYAAAGVDYASGVMTALTIGWTTGSSASGVLSNKTTGSPSTITAANWAYRFVANRGW